MGKEDAKETKVKRSEGIESRMQREIRLVCGWRKFRSNEV